MRRLHVAGAKHLTLSNLCGNTTGSQHNSSRCSQDTQSGCCQVSSNTDSCLGQNNHQSKQVRGGCCQVVGLLSVSIIGLVMWPHMPQPTNRGQDGLIEGVQPGIWQAQGSPGSIGKPSAACSKHDMKSVPGQREPAELKLTWCVESKPTCAQMQPRCSR